MPSDPFDALRRPSPSRRPRVDFAVALRRQLEEELHVNTTNDQLDTGVDVARIPAMLHIGVADADRAMRFFGPLFDWEAERLEYRGHIRHYVYNTVNVTPCITDEPDAAPMQLGFTVDDVPATVRLVTDLGGVVVDDESTPGGGGFVEVRDPQGIALGLWRASGVDHPHAAITKRAPADLTYFVIRVPDADRSAGFFGELLGWRFEHDAGTDYFHVDDHEQPVAMGILGAAPVPEVRCYFRVADVEGARARVRELGGSAGETFEMGPLAAADCTDDQGDAFGIAELHAHER
jgi:predicted enzyme related to lactoylglutathione lyase